MEQTEKIKLIVSLVLAKVELLKIKNTNGGYDYHFLSIEDRKTVEDTLLMIDTLLNNL